MIGFCYYMLFCFDHSFILLFSLYFKAGGGFFSESQQPRYSLAPRNGTQALLTPDSHDAKLHSDSAAVYFKRAFRQDPSNRAYQISLELPDAKVVYMFSHVVVMLSCHAS
jgi:hypothetical protein